MSRRDEQIQHIASTKAKLTDEDSIALFAAFLRGDMGPALTEVIARRVEETTAELLELKDRQYEQRLEDVRAELQRQVEAADRRAAQSGYLAMRQFWLRLPGPSPFSDAVQREAQRLGALIPDDGRKTCSGCGGEPSFVTSGGATIHNDCPGQRT